MSDNYIDESCQTRTLTTRNLAQVHKGTKIANFSNIHLNKPHRYAKTLSKVEIRTTGQLQVVNELSTATTNFMPYG